MSQILKSVKPEIFTWWSNNNKWTTVHNVVLVIITACRIYLYRVGQRKGSHIHYCLLSGFCYYQKTGKKIWKKKRQKKNNAKRIKKYAIFIIKIQSEVPCFIPRETMKTWRYEKRDAMHCFFVYKTCNQYCSHYNHTMTGNAFFFFLRKN